MKRNIYILLLTISCSCFAQTAVQTEKVILRQQLQKENCYRGEPLEYTITWSSQPPIGRFRAVNIHAPLLEDKDFRIHDSHKAADQPDQFSLGIPFSGTRAIANLKKETINSTPYTSLKIKKIVIPTESGKFTIPPASITCSFSAKPITGFTPRGKPQGSGNLYQYPLYFNNNFFDRDTDPDDTTFKASSKPCTLTVMPLPANPPPLFNGLVGRYHITTHAEPTTLRVGDPISITMTISSDCYLEHVTLPPLELQPAITNNFRIIHDRRMSGITTKTINFTQTIYPHHSGNQQIPPVSIACFNPKTKQYEQSQSKPISITVKRCHIITGSIFNKEKKRNNSPYIRPIILTITATIIAAILILFIMRRTRTTATAKTITDLNQAYHKFNKNIAKAGSISDMRERCTSINSSITSYLAELMPTHTPGAITFSDFISHFDSKIEQNTIDTAQQLFHKLDQARFAPAPPPESSNIAAIAKKLVNQLNTTADT